METPETLKYAASHEWVKDNGDGTATIGITAHAQLALGDIVFVELPEVGKSFSAGEEFGVVESVKAASDLYVPISGEVIEANTNLEQAPEVINESPYEEGWLMKLKISNSDELSTLLDAKAYLQRIAEE